MTVCSASSNVDSALDTLKKGGTSRPHACAGVKNPRLGLYTQQNESKPVAKARACVRSELYTPCAVSAFETHRKGSILARGSNTRSASYGWGGKGLGKDETRGAEE